MENHTLIQQLCRWMKGRRMRRRVAMQLPIRLAFFHGLWDGHIGKEPLGMRLKRTKRVFEAWI